MAFLIKNRYNGTSNSASRQGTALVEQLIRVSSAAKTLPATTTSQIFRVYGGRVMVKALLGECTTVCSATATNLKVSSKKLDNSAAAVGTAVDVCANAAVTSKEVGSFYFVEGDATAAIVTNAGAALPASGTGVWVAPQGEIYLTTDATNTGAFKWDIWYQPLDAGAYVEAVNSATAAI